jgi:hypothetical protein
MRKKSGSIMQPINRATLEKMNQQAKKDFVLNTALPRAALSHEGAPGTGCRITE